MDLQNIISRLEREVEILQDKEKENVRLLYIASVNTDSACS